MNDARPKLDFSQTERAFSAVSNGELRFRFWVFRLMNNLTLSTISTNVATWALRLNLPVSWVVKPTIFRVFCGGETILESLKAVKNLNQSGIGAILDYSVEGQNDEKAFEATEAELLKVIDAAATHTGIPVACMKITGIAPHSLLEKMSEGLELDAETSELKKALLARFERICARCAHHQLPIYIDAEESWIQPAIDNMVEQAMKRWNKEKAIVFQTVQLFRHDRLAYLKNLGEHARLNGYILGVKLVRGAYMEKERARANEIGTESPVHKTKEATDSDYNAALRWCMEHLDHVELCAGTHNEESALLLANLMDETGLDRNDRRIYFSQLYGMSDYMSFNLRHAGFNVSKYLPYGPVADTLPYLIRRARENTAMAGQVSKEFGIVQREMRRRQAQR